MNRRNNDAAQFVSETIVVPCGDCGCLYRLPLAKLTTTKLQMTCRRCHGKTVFYKAAIIKALTDARSLPDEILRPVFAADTPVSAPTHPQTQPDSVLGSKPARSRAFWAVIFRESFVRTSSSLLVGGAVVGGLLTGLLVALVPPAHKLSICTVGLSAVSIFEVCLGWYFMKQISRLLDRIAVFTQAASRGNFDIALPTLGECPTEFHVLLSSVGRLRSTVWSAMHRLGSDDPLDNTFYDELLRIQEEPSK